MNSTLQEQLKEQKYRIDLADTIKRSINIMEDAISLRKYRLGAAYKKRQRGGGNWSIPILCFIALENLGVIYWLLHNESLRIDKMDTSFHKFLSKEEQNSPASNNDNKVGAPTRFYVLCKSASAEVELTFSQQEVDLRNIWKTFRNVPVHNSAFQAGTAGAVFYDDPYTDRQIDKILSNPVVMKTQPPLKRVDNPAITTPWKSFYKEAGEWHCFGDILATEVIRIAEWLISHGESRSIEEIKRVLKYVDRNLLTKRVIT